MSYNKSLSVIFENLDAVYQMLMSSGKYEPSCRPKTAIFRFIISIYFPPFFIDHPVEIDWLIGHYHLIWAQFKV